MQTTQSNARKVSTEIIKIDPSQTRIDNMSNNHIEAATSHIDTTNNLERDKIYRQS